MRRNYSNNFRYSNQSPWRKLAANNELNARITRMQNVLSKLQNQKEYLQNYTAAKQEGKRFDDYVSSLHGVVPYEADAYMDELAKKNRTIDDLTGKIKSKNKQYKEDLSKAREVLAKGTQANLETLDKLRGEIQKQQDQLGEAKTKYQRLVNEFDAGQRRESAARVRGNNWRSGAYSLGGAGIGYGLTSLLTRNPWLRATGAGIGGIGGYLAANPKLVSEFINSLRNTHKTASVHGNINRKILYKLASRLHS